MKKKILKSSESWIIFVNVLMWYSNRNIFKQSLSIIFVFLFYSNSNAQYKKKLTYFSWSTGVTSTHFLSDLGGKDGDGTNDIRDLNINQTRFAFSGGLQYHFGKMYSVGLNSYAGTLAASDFQTKSSRFYRQITVRTRFLEVAPQFKLTIPYRVKYWKNLHVSAGGGLLFYNPQGYYNGTWHNLRPLGTEGQNIDPSKSTYPVFSPVITLGFGRIFYLPNAFTLSIDVCLRKSFSDYLDDTSTDYADPTQIRQKSGDAAAHFSNPSEYGYDIIGSPGGLRANPENNDNYFFIGFTINRPIGGPTRVPYYPKPKIRYNWPKPGWIKRDGSIPKLR